MLKPDDLCPRPEVPPPSSTRPLVPPLHLTAVYQCDDPEQAAAILSGDAAGFVYRRDGHPNADLLAEKCRLLHGAERAIVCGSGMSALSAAVLALLEKGDQVVASNRLYGQSLNLLTNELPRLGMECTTVDTCDLRATAAAVTPRTKLIVVETITNPLLRVSDIAALADIAKGRHARLLVDNTLAGPTVCRPLEHGADLVLESLTKIMNGHSDVILGVLCGPEQAWQRVPGVVSVWGLCSSPFDCWLAARGLGTLALRAERACANAQRVAEYLCDQQVEAVHYPGLPRHADHALARRQLGGRFGHMATFTLPGGTAAARAFIQAARRVPFSPSLGDLSTTLSHPESTSHRKLTAEARAALGIFGGTIRLSIGIESSEAILEGLAEGFAALS
jgi:cystathionine beta-lyase/cystathionine gamma-synthase